MDIKEIQTRFDSEKVVELALTFDDLTHLVNSLITLLEYSNVLGHDLFVIHFLSSREKQPSVVIENLKIQRLTSLSLLLGKVNYDNLKTHNKKVEQRRVKRVHECYDDVLN